MLGISQHWAALAIIHRICGMIAVSVCMLMPSEAHHARTNLQDG